jgi:hypothetical protein
MPIGMFLWVVGWTMFWVGVRKKREPKQANSETPKEVESFTAIPMISDELEEHEA